MILEIQKKIFRNGLDLTEKTLDTLYKDKTFLQLSSVGLNMGLWWQKSCNRGASWLFKGLNVPTEDHIKSLLETLHSLENRNDQQEDRIKELEAELSELKGELKKAPTPRTRKKKTTSGAAYSH